MIESRMIAGDCLDVLPTLDADSIDTVITDPPYGLDLLGQEWDRGVPGVPFWTAMLRVAKPGASLLAFGGTRVHHRLMCAIEDAGWEIRDCLMWLYGSGLPKSRNLHGTFEGWGTALKPAWEPIVLAMKPMPGTFDQNALAYGVAGLNIDGSRIPMNGEIVHTPQSDPANRAGVVGTNLGFTRNDAATFRAAQAKSVERTNTLGRWPANVIIEDGAIVGQEWARYFYSPKPTRAERDAGTNGNHHSTVKPLALMEYLCTLTATPTGSTVLDPFAGSGTTGIACINTGRNFVGIEKNADYAAIAEARIQSARAQLGLFGL